MLQRARTSLERLLSRSGPGAPVVLGVAVCLGVAAGAALLAPRARALRAGAGSGPLQSFLGFAWRPLLVTLAVAGVQALGAHGQGDEAPTLWGAIQSLVPWREARPRGVTIH